MKLVTMVAKPKLNSPILLAAWPGISNVAITDPVPGQEASHEEVLATGAEMVPRLKALLDGVLARQQDL